MAGRLAAAGCIRPLVGDLPEFAKKVDLALGEAYERLGQPDRELDVYHKALMRDPTMLTAKLGEARAPGGAGNSEQAIDSLSELVRSLALNDVGVPAVVRNQLLQFRFAQQIRLPKENAIGPTWVLARGFIDDPTQTDTQKSIILADIRLMQDRVDEAKAILIAARKRSPRIWPSGWRWLNVMQRDYNSERIQAFLDQARKDTELGDIVPLHAQANLWARGDNEQLRPRLLSLENGLDKFSVEQQTAFWSDMGNLYYRLRDHDNTRRCWIRWLRRGPPIRGCGKPCSSWPSSSPSRRASARAPKRCVNSSGRIAAFTSTRGPARSSGRSGNRSSVGWRGAMPNPSGEAKMGRSDWYEVARLGAEIDELDGKIDDAIAGYRRALDLSPGHAATARRGWSCSTRAAGWRRLVTRSNSSARCRRRTRCKKSIPTSPGSSAFGERRSRRRNEPSRVAGRTPAIECGLASCSTQPAARPTPERKFRRAVELRAKAGTFWLVLTHHLMATNKPNTAAEVLLSIERRSPRRLTPGIGPILRADRRRQGSRETLCAARQEHPDDTSGCNFCANFDIRTKQTPQLEKTLDKLIDACLADKGDEFRDRLSWCFRRESPDAQGARRFRELAESSQGDRGNSQNGHYTTEDATLLAGMLSERPESEICERRSSCWRNCRPSVPCPTSCNRSSPSSTSAGRWDKAREQLLNLLGRLGNNPGYMTMLALLQLKHNEVDDAARWIDKVVALQPKSTAALELRPACSPNKDSPRRPSSLSRRPCPTRFRTIGSDNWPPRPRSWKASISWNRPKPCSANWPIDNREPNWPWPRFWAAISIWTRHSR